MPVFQRAGPVSLRIRASHVSFADSCLRAEKQDGGQKRAPARLYIRRVSASRTAHPIRRLIGLGRFRSPAPGGSRQAEFTVNPGDPGIYMEAEGRKPAEPGNCFVYAGGSCPDERVWAELIL